MTKRNNHYEAAFEGYLRARQTPYVAVDEAKRALLADGSLKSLDFIVSAASRSWLVDVKGRLFPAGEEQKQYWKNWSTRDDLQSLAQWERLFGAQFTALLVFAFQVVGDRTPLPPDELFEFRGLRYAFIAVRLADYAYHARPISTAWDTLAMSAAQFRQVAVPMDQLLAAPVEPESQPAG